MRVADLVLVTRSEPGASALVAALERAGFRAFAHPVIEIRAKPPGEVVANDVDWTVAIFVSAHAVAHGLPLLSESIGRNGGARQWVAVGRSTAHALAAKGITAIHPIDETSEGILALPALADVAGRAIVIVAGAEGRDVLANVLRKRGAKVTVLRSYERRPTTAPIPRWIVESVDTVVLSSVDGARAFARQWMVVGGSSRVRTIVPSARVAEAARSLGYDNLLSSRGASDDAVVEALRRVERT